MENSKEFQLNVLPTYLPMLEFSEENGFCRPGDSCEIFAILTNSGDVYDALNLVKELSDDIDHLIRRYSKCISKSTPNFLEWLTGDYKKRLRSYIRVNFDKVKTPVH